VDLPIISSFIAPSLISLLNIHCSISLVLMIFGKFVIEIGVNNVNLS
jgi:hypothetical protein